ncbi:DUF3618 domain-containing protein [Nitrosomonas aestuarii]|uniref:DUF3618 domain-containing protein n=1 Tax=Nitrosomonas aestuarii TaxID=52441 RepID=UPI000D3242A9|nr:DUF3618 domain-containing protein [Nitrosomonas aestuarii]PTN10960.1 uncharacterized protein DUF3618 [Nitrosomonas aestuarii]
MDNNHRNPQQLEADIEKTREQMSDTLEEIHDRLSPNQLVDNAFEYFSDKLLRNNNYFSSLTETAKKNPAATALIGLGLGWLIISGQNNETQTKTASSQEDSGADKATDTQLKNHTDSAAGNANSKKDTRLGSTNDTKEKVSQHNGNQTESPLHKLHEQPLVLIGAGLALGAALGVYLSSTQRSDKLSKKNLEKQIDQAAETGSEQLEKVKEAVTSAVETISQAVDEVSNASEAREEKNKKDNNSTSQVAEKEKESSKQK